MRKISLWLLCRDIEVQQEIQENKRMLQERQNDGLTEKRSVASMVGFISRGVWCEGGAMNERSPENWTPCPVSKGTLSNALFIPSTNSGYRSHWPLLEIKCYRGKHVLYVHAPTQGEHLG